MKGSLTKICRGGFLCSFILLAYITMTSSMTLDLTELRNKVSKIKVNPRGNLWATGHFMGKKSVVDSSFTEPASEDVYMPTDVGVLIENTEDLRTKLFKLLKTSRQTQQKRPLHIGGDLA